MNHQHAYGFWHIHQHAGAGEHDHGHCHFQVMVHDHGLVTKVHSHKTRGFHPGEDKPPGGYKEHHGKDMAVWELNSG